MTTCKYSSWDFERSLQKLRAQLSVDSVMEKWLFYVDSHLNIRKIYIWTGFQKYPKPFIMWMLFAANSLITTRGSFVVFSVQLMRDSVVSATPSLTRACLNFPDDPTCLQSFRAHIATCLSWVTDPCSHLKTQFFNVHNLRREMNNDRKMGKLRNAVLCYWK